jgi:hypothetical protein
MVDEKTCKYQILRYVNIECAFELYLSQWAFHLFASRLCKVYGSFCYMCRQSHRSDAERQIIIGEFCHLGGSDQVMEHDIVSMGGGTSSVSTHAGGVSLFLP